MKTLGRYTIICLILFFVSFEVSSAVSRRDAVVDAVQKASPAVVNISSEVIVEQQVNPFFGFRGNDMSGDPFRDFFERFGERRQYRTNSLGSGVIINSSGIILTNYHVVERASKITVKLLDGRSFEASVIGADPKSDMAVIKIKSDKLLPYLPMAKSSDLMIGETVIAIGNPFGLSGSVTTGVISAVGRSVTIKSNQVFTDFIQTDASINPGNSGGALLNINGELIGINTAIIQDAQGIGFAIPIDRAKRIVTDLLNYGKVRKAWIGAYVQDLNDNYRRLSKYRGDEGAVINRILDKSPASLGGLKAGDIIVGIDNAPIADSQQYHQEIASFTPGNKITFKIFRNDYMTVKVTATNIPAEKAGTIADSILGVKVSSISDDTVRRYRLYPGTEGVVVSGIKKGSPAEKLGLMQGDVLLQIAGVEVRNKQDFDNAVFSIDTIDTVPMVVLRGRTKYYVSLDID